MNLCSKREEKKCKKQILPAGQPRGAASGPGSKTALAGFLPELTGALGCFRGVAEGGTLRMLGWGGIELGGGGAVGPLIPAFRVTLFLMGLDVSTHVGLGSGAVDA